MSRASAAPTGRRPVGDDPNHGTMVASLLAGRGTGDGQRRDRHRARGRPHHRVGGVRPGHGGEQSRTTTRSPRPCAGRSTTARTSSTCRSPATPATGPRAGTTRSCTRSRTTSSWSPRPATAAAARARWARPATIPGVLTVAGVDRDKNASFDASSQGITIAVAAPSEDLVGVLPDGELRAVERHERRGADRVGPRRAHPQRVSRARRRERHRTTHSHGRSARAARCRARCTDGASSTRSRR